MICERDQSRGNERSGRCVCVASVVVLCCLLFELGAWQMGGARGDRIHKYVLHHSIVCPGDPALKPELDSHGHLDASSSTSSPFPSCPHEEDQRGRSRCLVPAPPGYVTPFPWPKSREFVPLASVGPTPPEEEEAGRWGAHLDGDVLVFPPRRAEAYLDDLASVVPIGDGTVRTALDTACGVASWGAYLLDSDVLVMSVSRSRAADARLALERGVPAVVGAPGDVRLPYPSRSFDMARCSRCLVSWTSDDGMRMMEIDRVLRPGGYWILSGCPINSRGYNNTQDWSKEDLEKEKKRIEDLAELLCWEKKYEKGDVAIWRKGINDASCTRQEERSSIEACDLSEVADIWNKKMAACITPYPKVNKSEEIAGGRLEKFPKRLFAVPPRVARRYVPGVSAKIYIADSISWKNCLTTYKKLNNFISTPRYRNIMDMNAGFGGFAAALESPNSWVMNVVPTISKNDTLGVIYERGLIGIYHDWCEAFSSHPRTYDLIHASGVFSLYQDKCEMEDILLEMDRILRPEGAVIFHDDVDILIKVKSVASHMRWDMKMSDYEDGPLTRKKILMAVKRYWVTGDAASSTS